ncbi:Protease II [Pseudoalteromonas luteoviolacea B = ATCC 29581]|nr:Protease II [Pseudoalteromonas luteoviolacea B = ATCC 29581]
MSNSALRPPIAPKIPHQMSHHDHTRLDNYYWMRDDDRKRADVLAHLEAENGYCEKVMAKHSLLQKTLFEELKGRIVKDDMSVPIKDGHFWYVSEVAGDNEYPTFARADNAGMDDKQCLLDANELAIGHDYFDLGDLTISPNEQFLSYSQDTDSRRIYDIYFKDLNSGELLSDTLQATEGQVVWSNDNQCVYYVKKDLDPLLGYQVFRHKLGTLQSQDELVYEEQDRQFFMGLAKSRDESLIFIYLSATDTTDLLVLDANSPYAKPQRLFERQSGHEFGLDKFGKEYFIVSNWQAKNFCLYTACANTIADINQWQMRIAHRDEVLIEGVELFDSHFVITEREAGQIRFIVHSFEGSNYTVDFVDDCYFASLGLNPEPSQTHMRLHYCSMTTPSSVYDVCLKSGEKTLLKQQRVLGDFNQDAYQSERVTIEARDGTLVPVSLVYKKALFKQDGTNPLLQYGYGAYGITIDPTFSSSILSLLDRGFVYAIAHVRGSEMLGRVWYEQGKLANKQNTFNDFIDVTHALVKQGYAATDKVFASGGSAGGLLMGVIANQAPTLYRGIGAHVPFLDVLTTMLDESIPLTTNEYEEWGNPNREMDYQTILAYSPMDNVKAQDYPNILVTTGLHDSQVQYWEPMKWVAKLREYKTDNNILIFKTDMDAGHGGASGRFKSLEERALEFAFFIGLLD